MEEKKNKGGARVGAGRKSLVDEENVNFVLLSTLKEIHKTENDLDAKKGFVKDLLESQRGQLFVAEHIFGKPKETIDQNVSIKEFDLKDVIKFIE